MESQSQELEAKFCITNPKTLEERLFALMMLGDDRSIQATHLMGKRQYSRSKP